VRDTRSAVCISARAASSRCRMIALTATEVAAGAILVERFTRKILPRWVEERVAGEGTSSSLRTPIAAVTKGRGLRLPPLDSHVANDLHHRHVHRSGHVAEHLEVLLLIVKRASPGLGSSSTSFLCCSAMPRNRASEEVNGAELLLSGW
jgi:hypothetical protein